MELRSQNIANDALVGDPDFANPVNLPEHLCIGKDMHNFIYELRRHGAHILKLLSETPIDPNVHSLMENYILQYSKQSCKVAVVGQMKAGKSAFINALIGRRSYLPSDVNPWTTVVTRLHFGVPSLPTAGASFKFFDEGEWNAIAHGGGRLRELVQRFLPGFASEKLEQKLQEMRSKAENRFGPEFNNLLGKSHTFETADPELLEKYVCAGNAWSENQGQIEAGHYADITKSADLFFKSSPFLYPTTLIDTPGTNDPFFVRDEITYRNLDDADIFVIVLPAQQAFSMSDLALLRILQGLNKDRIIIYINRVDQLDNLQNDTKDIVSHVQYMLKKEFPSFQIPVILGSAQWGQQALEDDYSKIDLGANHMSSILTPEDMQEEEKVRSKLYFYSGIPDVASEISRMMLKGKGRNSVGAITSNLRLATESVKAVVDNQMKRLKSSSAGSMSSNSETCEAELQNISKKLEYLEKYTNKSNYYHIQYEKKLQNIKEVTLTSLRSRLQKVVADFAMLESRNLVDAMENGDRKRTWQCDTLIIRKCLEEEYLLISKTTVSQINEIQSSSQQELQLLIKETAPDVDDRFVAVDPISDGEPYLSSTVLKHSVALDLDQSWWKLWGARKRQSQQWAQELNDLINSEFHPIIEQLVFSAETELNQIIADSNRNFSAISKSIANILMELAYELQQKSDSLLQEERNNSSEDLMDEAAREVHDRQFAVCSDLIKRVDIISQHLQQLSERYEILCAGTEDNAS
ncbi:MAG: dynamin family protein [Methyloligellaceae bacterium]